MKQLLLAFLLVVPSLALAEDEIIKLGRAAYDAQCSRCHGPEGKGDGYDSKRLPVVPRDLTSGVFKFRTTASGTPPSDQDILWILNHGLAGSGMPSFANLDKSVKESLVAYVKSLSTTFKDYKPEPIAPPNEKIKVDLKKGAEVYTLLQCAKCHGEHGRANGPSAPTLVDAWQRPIRSADLTQDWTYRAGSNARDIYYRLMAGLNGTPMPSYDGAVPANDAWQLANYVVSLQLDTNWSYSIKALEVKDELPVDFNSPLWDKAERTDVNLQKAHYAAGRRERTNIGAVSVQVVYNDKEMAFRLFWNDPFKSEKNPPDAFLVAIKPREFSGEARANLYTLYTANAPALDLMSWKSSREDAVAQQFSNEFSVGASGRTLKAKATYDDGVWMLVFKRSFNLEERNKISPDEQKQIQLGFAAWDGNAGESGLNRSNSQWITLSFAPEADVHH